MDFGFRGELISGQLALETSPPPIINQFLSIQPLFLPRSFKDIGSQQKDLTFSSTLGAPKFSCKSQAQELLYRYSVKMSVAYKIWLLIGGGGGGRV